MFDVDLIDLESYREAMNYSTASDKDRAVSASENALLKLDDHALLLLG